MLIVLSVAVVDFVNLLGFMDTCTIQVAMSQIYMTISVHSIILYHSAFFFQSESKVIKFGKVFV